MNDNKKDIKPINKRINRRANKAEVERIIDRVVDLCRQNMQYRDIKKVLQGEIGKSEKQCEAYITKAFKRIREDFEENIDVKRSEFIQSLYGDLLEAEKNYKAIQDPESKMKTTWFKLMLEAKDRIAKFMPEKVTDDSQVISVEYKVISRDED